MKYLNKKIKIERDSEEKFELDVCIKKELEEKREVKEKENKKEFKREIKEKEDKKDIKEKDFKEKKEKVKEVM